MDQFPLVKPLFKGIDKHYKSSVSPSSLQHGYLHDFTHGGLAALRIHFETNNEEMYKVTRAYGLMMRATGAYELVRYFGRRDMLDHLDGITPDE